MALQSQLSKIAYEGNGSTSTPYAIPFPFITASDIKVYIDDAQLLSGFSVLGAGEENGGSLTTDVAYDSAQTVLIMRVLELVQSYNYSLGAKICPEVLEQQQDVQLMQIQQINESQSRSITFPVGSDDVPPIPMEPNTTVVIDESGLPSVKTADQMVEFIGVLESVDEAKESAKSAAISAEVATNAEKEIYELATYLTFDDGTFLTF